MSSAASVVPDEVQQWRRKTPKCFLCLDVRRGTMLLSLLQFGLHTLAMMVLLFAIIQPQLLHRLFHRTFHCGEHHAMHIMDKRHAADSAHSVGTLHPLMRVIMMRMHQQPRPSGDEKHSSHMPASIALKQSHVLGPLLPPSLGLFHMPLVEGGAVASHPQMHIRLLAFGHRETMVLRRNSDGHPTLFISRMFGAHPPMEQGEGGSIPAVKIAHPAHLMTDAKPSDGLQLKEHRTTPHGLFKWISQRTHRCTRQQQFWHLMFVWLSLGFCFLLFYGAKNERPLYLLPYFTLQVFGYVLLAFSVVGYLSYLPHAKLWIARLCHLPFQHYLMRMNERVLGMALLGVGLLLLALKAYLLGMVWSCYRHLQVGRHLQRIVSQRRRAEQSDEVLLFTLSGDEKSEKTPSLPDYENLLKTPINTYNPPPYFEGITGKEKQ